MGLTKLHGVNVVADRLGISTRTLERWKNAETKAPVHVMPALDNLFGSQYEQTSKMIPEKVENLTFVDLFAGIGGLRMGFETSGAQCVFTSEWDKYAVQTYSENFQSTHQIAGDITKVTVSEVPNHDILIAGFPCQPFSVAGVSKKNSLGRSHGFLDKTQGTLFFNVAAIIAEKRPKAFLLENVKNLMSHDKGNTFKVIRAVLEEDLGYEVSFRVIDARGMVPQHRERVFIVGMRDQTHFDWSGIERLLAPNGSSPITLASVLHSEERDRFHATDQGRFVDSASGAVHEKYTLTDRLWAYLQDYAAKHKAKGNGFGYGLVTPEMTARTLSARYYKDGSEILVSQGPHRNPRRLTPRECARLMGFPESYKIPVSDTQAYRQFGNSVVVPVVAAIAEEMTQSLRGQVSKTNG